MRKRTLYARGGVREYWIVDPDVATIQVIGADGKTVELVIATTDRELTLHSPLLGELTALTPTLDMCDMHAVHG